MLAGTCTLCGKPDTILRAAWTAHRETLIAEWRFQFPMWAQCRFDGAPLGPPREPLSVYRSIACALDDA